MELFLSKLFRFCLIVVVAAALYLSIVQNGTVVWGALAYFTIQSNLLAVLYTTYLLVAKPSNKSIHTCLRGVILIALSLTGIVYNFVLYNIFADWGTVGYTFARSVLHIVTPIGFALDWIVFDRHGDMHLSDAPKWLLYPLIYAAISLVANVLTGNALYFFLTKNTLLYLPLAAILLLFICFVCVQLDHLLGDVQRRHSSG